MRRGNPREQEEKEFEQRVLDLSRVTRVTAGGKRMRFRACIAIGDKKGRVGVGVAKGADVASAIVKANRQAEKNCIKVTMRNETIPHRVDAKFGAAVIMIKPAPAGTGIKAGGVVRILLALAGVPNAVSKVFGSNNKINNARATIQALQSFKVR
ncbi:30S ribosomal protein S5 [Candidatus Uhrbacteria bacterium]|nr:30S ribosomal protein S5 [Candidatus Uhrbacteria bacterium]